CFSIIQGGLVAVLRTVLRIYSYLFEAILCLTAIAVSAVALLSPSEDLELGWLPWTGMKLDYWLLGLGVAGLLCVLLAAAGKLRFLLFLFSAIVVGLLIRGFFLSPYAFQGPAGFKRALCVTAG